MMGKRNYLEDLLHLENQM